MDKGALPQKPDMVGGAMDVAVNFAKFIHPQAAPAMMPAFRAKPG